MDDPNLCFGMLKSLNINFSFCSEGYSLLFLVLSVELLYYKIFPVEQLLLICTYFRLYVVVADYSLHICHQHHNWIKNTSTRGTVAPDILFSSKVSSRRGRPQFFRILKTASIRMLTNYTDAAESLRCYHGRVSKSHQQSNSVPPNVSDFVTQFPTGFQDRFPWLLKGFINNFVIAVLIFLLL